MTVIVMTYNLRDLSRYWEALIKKRLSGFVVVTFLEIVALKRGFWFNKDVYMCEQESAVS